MAAMRTNQFQPRSLIALALGFYLALGLLAQSRPALAPLRVALSGSADGSIPSPDQSPVTHLRRLLKAEPSERERLLQQHAASKRSFWERKINQYQAMDAGEQQRRLQEAQWHWYLMLVMRAPDPLRARLVEQIPIEDRPLIQDRLQAWQAMPEDLQRDILLHLPALQYFARFAALKPAEQQQALAQGQPVATQGWQSLDQPRQRSLFQTYQSFIGLEAQQQRQVLARIPIPQRMSLQERLVGMDHLSPELRRRCLEALDALKQMNAQEQVRFRQTALQWKDLSGDAMDAVRQVATRIPPLPPVRQRKQPPIPQLRRPPPLPVLAPAQRESTSTR
jgi:hypothetical protein